MSLFVKWIVFRWKVVVDVLFWDVGLGYCILDVCFFKLSLEKNEFGKIGLYGLYDCVFDIGWSMMSLLENL